MQEFTVEGEKTYWGDKCSDRYRKRRQDRAAAGHSPTWSPCARELLLDGLRGGRRRRPAASASRAPCTSYDRFPFWRRFLRELGFARGPLRDETNRRIAQDGLDVTVAEPCFPISVAHGHVQDLLEKGVD